MPDLEFDGDPPDCSEAQFLPMHIDEFLKIILYFTSTLTYIYGVGEHNDKHIR